MTYINNAMGWVLAQLSQLFGHNFAASVLVFTILINLLMLPLTLKSQRSTAKQARLKPKLDALKKKYGNDKQKYSRAMSDLYTKEGVSMSGGCLPLIIRLIIMMGVYWAVVSPMTHVLQIDTTAINAAKQWSAYVRVAEDESFGWNDEEVAARVSALAADEGISEKAKELGYEPEYYAKLTVISEACNTAEKPAEGSVEEKIQKSVKSHTVSREVEIIEYLGDNEDGSHKYPVVLDVFTVNGGELEELNKINFGLFGIDLKETPDFSLKLSNWQAIWIIPIASFVTAMLTSIISMKIQKKANPDAPNMAAMMLLMPLFSLYIAFQVPGAVGFYWACSNLVSGGLQAAAQMLYGPSVIIAEDQSKAVVKRLMAEKARIEKVNAAEAEKAADAE